MAEIMDQLKVLNRLESKIDAATNKVTEDLDVIRGEIVKINDGRKEDRKQINDMKKSIKKLTDSTNENADLVRTTNSKVTNLDNKANKNSERISKIEETLKNFKTGTMKDNIIEQAAGAGPSKPRKEKDIDPTKRKNIEIRVKKIIIWKV